MRQLRHYSGALASYLFFDIHTNSLPSFQSFSGKNKLFFSHRL